VAQPDLAPEPPSGELQPGQGVDGDGVRVDAGAHVADHQIRVAALQQEADPSAEPGDIGAGDRTADDHDECGAWSGRRSQHTQKDPPTARNSSLPSATDDFCAAAPSYPARPGRSSPEESRMSLPQIASRDEWLVARRELLAREKEFTRARDALNADRRRLPMVRIEKDYVFQGPEGRATLLDLFDGRHQLIVQHFMFDPPLGERLLKLLGRGGRGLAGPPQAPAHP
jgi:hypothetical protein